MANALEEMGGLGGLAGGAALFAQQLRIPRTGKDPETTVGGQASPETPHKRAFAFLVGRFAKGDGFKAARVEPATQGVDDLAAPAGFLAGENEQDFAGGLFQAHLQLNELLAKSGDACVVGFLGQSMVGTRCGHVGRREQSAARGVENGFKRVRSGWATGGRSTDGGRVVHAENRRRRWRREVF